MSKTSMSVMEMGKSLGLGKTESYWLVHKKQFETRFVAGKMRVMVESFERWYANQLHYKKISGELPGKELLKRTMTVPTMAKLLGIKEANAYELIHRLHFRSVKTEYSSQRLLIDKATFNEWLKKQTHYKIVEGKEDFYDRAELSEAQ
ncbi:MAG: DNA-binding protein [Ruminococcus sp.]